MSCYVSNTTNQLVTPFSDVRYSTRHGSTSARAWEDGIDEVLLQTDCSIEKLTEMQRPKEDLNKYSQLPGRARARSTSASRLSSTASSREENLPSTAALEQKVNFMYRRIKMLDDKVKSMEKEKLDNRNFTIDTMSAIRHMADAQAADQRQILLLKDNAMSLRSGVELLNRREKEMPLQIESRTGRAGAVDQDGILEAVTKVIRINFRSKVKDAAEAFAAEHAMRVAKWTEKSVVEIDRLRLESQRFELQAIPVIESELRGLVSELERLKGRQDKIDDSYRCLEGVVASREKETEKANKKAVRLYKKEMSTVMDIVGKRMNEQLTLSRSQDGDHARGNESLLQRLCTVEAFQKELSARLETSSLMSKEALSVAKECQVNAGIMSLTDTATAIPSLDTRRTSSLKSIVEELNADVRDMKSLHSKYELSSSMAIETLTSSNSRMKGKINELSASMVSLSRIREAVETLLIEVHQQTKRDHIPKGDHISNGGHTGHTPEGDKVINRDNGHKGDHIVTRDYGPLGDQVSNVDHGPPVHNITNGDYRPKGDQKNIFLGIHARLESLERKAFNICNEEKKSSKAQQLVPENDLMTIQGIGLSSAAQVFIENEISRLQADLEDTVSTGWSDVMARNMVVAQDGLKLKEVVQVLQTNVIDMQSDQQRLVERVISLESHTANNTQEAVLQGLSSNQIIECPHNSLPSAHTQRKDEDLSVNVTEQMEGKNEVDTRGVTKEEIEVEDRSNEQLLTSDITSQKDYPVLELRELSSLVHQSTTIASESSASLPFPTSYLYGTLRQPDS